MSKRDTLTVVLAYTGVLGLTYAILRYIEPRALVLTHPTGAITPPPPPPPPQPQPVTGPSLAVYPGRRYAAAVNISSPLSWLASASKVKSYAEKQGFTNVVVTEETRPVGSPLLGPKADYFVDGVFAGPTPKTFARETGPVTIAEAWQV